MALQAENDTGSRLAVAQGVLSEIVRPADPKVTAGLRVFGTGAQAQSCQDTALVVPLAVANQGQISTQLLSLITGDNPDAAMGEAMVSAIRDLAPTAGPHTLVVVTGGADSCNPEAGQLIAAEAKKAGITLQLFVVGYQVPDDQGDAIKGLVDEAGNGNYINARDKLELEMILDSIQHYVDHPDITPVISVLETAQAAAIGPGGQPTATGSAGSGEATPDIRPSSTPGSSSSNATAEPTTGGAATTGQTACDHEYFPMRLGATWTFSTSNGNQTWTVTELSGDQTSATATMSFSMGDISGNYHWQCSAAGITSFDFSNLAFGGSTVTTMEVTDQSGIWLPPVEQLVPGATWRNDYSLNFSTTTEGQTVNISERIGQAFTAVGIEQLSVAGAVHDAFRVDQSSTIAITSLGNSNTLNTTGAIFYARGIGPVRLDSSGAGYSESSLLQSYSIP
jgi:hypothetical protein